MWTYEQATGQLTDPDGSPIAIGYAGGNCGDNPEGVNNPDMQDQHSIGPLPRGRYTFSSPVDNTHLGPFAMPLIPEPDNEMFGRSAFFCHGDNPHGDRSASQGCIIMPRAVRNAIWQSADHLLEVI